MADFYEYQDGELVVRDLPEYQVLAKRKTAAMELALWRSCINEALSIAGDMATCNCFGCRMARMIRDTQLEVELLGRR